MDYRKERMRKRLKRFDESDNIVFVIAALICIIIIVSCVLIAKIVTRSNYERLQEMAEQTMSAYETGFVGTTAAPEEIGAGGVLPEISGTGEAAPETNAEDEDVQTETGSEESFGLTRERDTSAKGE